MDDGPVLFIEAGERLFIDGRELQFFSATKVRLPRSARFMRSRDLAKVDEDSELAAAYRAVEAAHLAIPAAYPFRLRDAMAALRQLPNIEAKVALRALQLDRTYHALLALQPAFGEPHAAHGQDRAKDCA